MQLKNYMEEIVWQKLDAVMETRSDVCKCERCRYDIASLALNFLPPRYVVTDKGETYTKIQALELQFIVDILSAISHAITIVQAKPHHDEK